MNDRELLECAANAACYVIGGEVNQYRHWESGGMLRRNCNGTNTIWTPLTDDGDALRLAVDLGLRINTCVSPEYIEDQPYAEVEALFFVNGLPSRVNVKEVYNGNSRAATRRAIVRAAAEIGKMKGEK